MTEATKELKVTTKEDLEKARAAAAVELPAFMDGTPFVVRLRRPSLLRMAQLGQIPEEYQPVIDKLVQGDDSSPMEIKAKIFAWYAEKALEEPTWADVEEVIDSFQLATIWHWGIFGPGMMEPFRKLRDLMGQHFADQLVAEAQARQSTEGNAA
jgi:hypothetical protein